MRREKVDMVWGRTHSRVTHFSLRPHPASNPKPAASHTYESSYEYEFLCYI